MLFKTSGKCLSLRICSIDLLESRMFLSASFPQQINFQPSDVAVPEYSRADCGAVYGKRANGFTYGWNALNSANTRARGSSLSPDERYDTFAHMQRNGSFQWEVAVPNGTYSVHVVAGDASFVDSTFRINVEGVLAVNGAPSAANHWVEGTSTVNVSDARLTISNAAGAVNNKICFVEINKTADAPAPSALKWSAVTSMPNPRFEGTGAVVGGKLYCFGGYLDTSYRPGASVNDYDPATSSWSKKRDLPIGMTQMGTATDGRYIYLAGGYVADAAKRQVFATTSVWRYDPVDDTYTTIQPLPSARGVGSMVYLSGKLYFFGGSDARRIDHAELFMLDLTTSGAGWVKLASMPAGRNRAGGVVLDGQIYCVGGQTSYDADAAYKSDVWRYDPGSNRWTTVASLHQARSHISASTITDGKRIFVLGGEGAGQSALKNVDAYDPAKNAWTGFTSLPSPRNNGIAAMIEAKMFFTGGLYGVFHGDTWAGILS